MSQLKGFVTSSRIVIDQKGIQQYEVDAIHRLITFSNDLVYAHVGKGQRRHLFLETNNVYSDSNCKAGTSAEKERQQHLDNILKCAPETVAKYLYEYDISDFNPRKVLHTRNLNNNKLKGTLIQLNRLHYGINGNVCLKKGADSDVVSTYSISDTIPKEIVFEAFKKHTTIQSRHCGSGQFWKELKGIFPKMKSSKRCDVPHIRFLGDYKGDENSHVDEMKRLFCS